MYTLRERYEQIKLREDTHSLHVEDSLLKGKDYIERMLGFFNHALEIVEGSDDSSQPRPTIKYDGAPAIVMWSQREDINESYGISTKSLFNNNPKYYGSDEEIDADKDRADSLKIKMKMALKLAAEKIIPEGEIWQGDLLWTAGDIKSITDDGINYVIAKPNTLGYAAPADSDVGERMKNSDIGIVFHTRYKGPLDEVKQSNDVDISECKNIPDWAFIFDAKLPDLRGKVTFDSNASRGLKNSIGELRRKCADLMDHENYDDLVSNEDFINFYMMTLQNHKIDKGEKIDPETFKEELHDWINVKMHKKYNDLSKLKTKAGRDKKRDTILSTSRELHYICRENGDLIHSIADALYWATYIKGILIEQFNKAQEWITKVEMRSGGWKNTSGEGFMISDNDGKFVKFVDRSAFSYFNRSSEVVKGFERITESEENKWNRDERLGKVGLYDDDDWHEAIEDDDEDKNTEVDENEQVIEIETELSVEEIENICLRVLSESLREAFEMVDTDSIEKRLKAIKSDKSVTWVWIEKINKKAKIHYSRAEKKPSGGNWIEVKRKVEMSNSSKKPIDNSERFLINKNNDQNKNLCLIIKNILIPNIEDWSIWKNIGLQISKSDSSSSILVNVWKDDDPLGGNEIEELSLGLKGVDGEDWSCSDNKNKRLSLTYKKFTINFRNTGGGKATVIYFDKNGNLKSIEKSSNKFSDSVITSIQESLTGLFLTMSFNNDKSNYAKYEKILLTIDNPIFVKNLVQKDSSTFNVSGFSNVLNSWRESIKNSSSEIIKRKILGSYKKLSSGQWKIIHPSLYKTDDSYLNSIIDFNPYLSRHLFSNFNYKNIMSRDTANPADIFIINTGTSSYDKSLSYDSLIEDLNNLRKDQLYKKGGELKSLTSVTASTENIRDAFVATLNKYFDAGILIGISLKKTTKNANVIKSATHNSLSENLNKDDLSCFVFNDNKNDTIKSFSFSGPPYLNKQNKNNGKSAYLIINVDGNHLHLGKNIAELKMDIRIPSSGNINSPPVSEIIMNQSEARFGKSTEAVRLVLNNFRKRYKSNIASYITKFLNQENVTLRESLRLFEEVYNISNRLYEDEDEDDTPDNINLKGRIDENKVKALKANFYLKCLIQEIGGSVSNNNINSLIKENLTKVFARGMKYKIYSLRTKLFESFNNGVVNYFKIF